MWDETATPTMQILLRLGAAAVAGMILGIDREARGKPAGLRTHILIAVGAAATTLVGFELYRTAIEISGQSRSDLLRVIEGVITALGFLAAGVIINGRGEVHNMTSAANIWICGAIGIACGGGYFVIAGITLALAVIVLTGLYAVERVMGRKSGSASRDG